MNYVAFSFTISENFSVHSSLGWNLWSLRIIRPSFQIFGSLEENGPQIEWHNYDVCLCWCGHSEGSRSIRRRTLRSHTDSSPTQCLSSIFVDFESSCRILQHHECLLADILPDNMLPAMNIY